MRCDICPNCRAVDAPPSQQIDRDHIRDDLPVIVSNGELNERFGLLIDETTIDHIVDPSGILAIYQVGERVTCSLYDRTPHNYGIVARVRCGLVLRIGNDCGRKHIEGFDLIDQMASDRRKDVAQLRSLEEQPVKLLAFYDWLRGDAVEVGERREGAVRPLLRLKREVRVAYPEIAKEIDRRGALEAGARNEVLIKGEPLAPDGKPGRDYGVSLDLTFMLADIRSHAIERDRLDVEDFIAKKVLADKKSRRVVRGLVKHQKQLNDRRQHWDDWIRSGQTFFAGRNLGHLVYATYEPKMSRPFSLVVEEHKATITKLVAMFNTAWARAHERPRAS